MMTPTKKMKCVVSSKTPTKLDDGRVDVLLWRKKKWIVVDLWKSDDRAFYLANRFFDLES